MSQEHNTEIEAQLDKLSGRIADDASPVAIILAAGHGKRIKSVQSKMLHEIWGVPTVVRVAGAAQDGLQSPRQVIVVGIKAAEVARSVGKHPERKFVLQREQNGTGDAARVAVAALKGVSGLRDIYIFPGDMGLITAEVVRDFKTAFEQSHHGMMILTGMYAGDIAENSYGRIVRVPQFDESGHDSGVDYNDVIEIREHKDILALPEDQIYRLKYKGKTYAFGKDELLQIREYNTGVYAVKYEQLKKHIFSVGKNNVQGEFYITDLLMLFLGDNISIGANPVADNSAVIGFNNKSVLKEMQHIARERVWKQLKDIIYLEDENDFFIAEEPVARILKLDAESPALEIRIGKGVYIGSGVTLSEGITIESGSRLDGNIILEKGVVIERNVFLQTSADQSMVLGKSCFIGCGNILKGSITIGTASRIKPGVMIRGAADKPTMIGRNVVIKGFSTVENAVIEDDVEVENSSIRDMRVKRLVDGDGRVRALRWFRPPEQGAELLAER